MSIERRVYFSDPEAFASFCAAMVREGLTFEAFDSSTHALGRFCVILTGGY